MTQLLLYSYRGSSAPYRLRATLEFRGLRYKHEPALLPADRGAHYSTHYRHVNPRVRVPGLVCNEGMFAQSMAIMQSGVELEVYPRIAQIERHCQALAVHQRALPRQQPDARPT